jgi:hypothetical protein
MILIIILRDYYKEKDRFCFIKVLTRFQSLIHCIRDYCQFAFVAFCANNWVFPPLTLACTLAPEAERMALAYARLK